MTLNARAESIRDWILSAGRMAPDLAHLIDGFAARLVDAGLPVERLVISLSTLHALKLSYYGVWRRGQAFEFDSFDRDEAGSGAYERSPFHLAETTGAWVELWLPETPDDRFSIVSEFKALGLSHYLCIPLPLSAGTRHFMTLASASPNRFSGDDLQLLRIVVPALAAALEVRMLRRMLPEVLQTYTGREAGQRVASGQIVRGDVQRIEAAILFADLRGFTEKSMAFDEEVLVRLLNEYFDCVVPAIEAEGGDVLKFIGDGLLAIFPADAAFAESPCQRAYQAAQASLSRLAHANTLHQDWPDLHAGFGIHDGSVAYGNIGSGSRLDFTVIGRDVNLTSRICDVCSSTGQPILFSGAAARGVSPAPVLLGHFALKGLAEPVAVFQPA